MDHKIPRYVFMLQEDLLEEEVNIFVMKFKKNAASYILVQALRNNFNR